MKRRRSFGPSFVGKVSSLGILYVTGNDLILANEEWFARRVEADRSRSQTRRTYDAAVTRGAWGVADRSLHPR
jgi:hypothetical protein